MTGLDALVADQFRLLTGRRVGLVTHPAALTTRGPIRSASRLFAEQTQLMTLFGPEHGLSGEAQDLIPVSVTGQGQIRVESLYGETFASLKPTANQLDGLDVLVIDMQDVGSRYYTFQATMLYCLEACATIGLPVMILDRPNPIGRSVEGPAIEDGYNSFIGPHNISTRHGLTMGELARFYCAERNIDVALTTVNCDPAAKTLFQIPPSPNMPTVETARVYPGMCLIEGTNLSEGRGTTRPFEYVGHPNLDADRAVTLLNECHLPGVEFLPTRFTPTFQKHANQSCAGVFVLPTSEEFHPVRTGLAVLIAFKQLLQNHFSWRTETYEFVSDRPAIDILFGSDRERTMIDVGATWQEVASYWTDEELQFDDRRKPFLT